MRVLIAGASGMLGRDVTAAAERARHQVTALGRTDLDVTDPGAVDEAVERARPEVVINCAAWTDVDGAEDSEDAAAAVNVDGALHLSTAAAKVDARIVYPSTDSVVDGAKGAPYVESDQPAPLNAYGRTKLAGERATAVAAPRHYIVRSAWLFGAGGANFVETMLQLAHDHGEVLVLHDQVGSPTYTAHLAIAIVRLIEGTSYGIHHMGCQGECSWYEFAREIFDQTGVECRVMSATTEMLGRPAVRPAYSALGTQREDAIPLPHWREGLAAYLLEREARRSGEQAGTAIP
jgi:dTDP-4-dehydrorhamnose reductase